MEGQRIKQEDTANPDDPFVFPASRTAAAAAAKPDTDDLNSMALDGQITDLPLFMSSGTTPSEASLHNPELLASHINGISNAKNTSTLTPNMLPPESPTTSQIMQDLTPLNQGQNQGQGCNLEKHTFPSAGISDSYALSNYYKPSSQTGSVTRTDSDVGTIKNQSSTPDKSGHSPIAKDELLDTIKLENGMLSNEITGNELTTAQTREGDAPNDNTSNSKSLTALKKNNKKKPLPSVPLKRPAFVVKLWKMVNDPSNDHYISWMAKGDAFQVKDRESFMKYVLPKYFKHNNFASFVRQLNMYGWHKIQDVNSGALVQTDEVWQFENPNFLKGREDLLDNIVRNKPVRENEEEEVDLKHLLSQLEQMKRNQMLISEDLRRVRQDNEMLWKENFIARERHKIQSETLDKIMRFLASIYGNNTTRLIEQMNGNPGDLVEINQNNGNYGANHYPTNYGYYVSTNSSNSGTSNNSHNNMADNLNVTKIDTSQNNHLYHHQVYNSRHPNQIQLPQGYDTPPGNAFQPNSNARRQLMIANRSHDITPSPNPSVSPGSTKSNELRMNNLGYVPSQADAIDSSIQEIHRGPENRNSNSNTLSNSIQHIPSYIDSPRPFLQPQKVPNVGDAIGNGSSNQMINNVSFDSNYSTQRSPYNASQAEYNQDQKLTQMNPNSKRPSFYGQTTPIASVSSVPMFDPSDSFNSNSRNSNNNLKTPTETVPNQLMGNIHQQLYKNQGALKQVNDWLNKYNDNLESDNISLPEDFKVDDFLQQPLDMNNVGATPVDFSSVDGFINTDSPIQTPVSSHPVLDVPNGRVQTVVDNKKRPYDQTGLNDTNLGADGAVNSMVDPSSNSSTAKRFKAVQ
ncbi:hypothetical protein PMKS-001590 [Pichia membranifaciens]|uniref:Heat shock transcription factor n=1 Tax=Pichia membranifaciens TaxID=4926 RepID=A0A1Q2YEY9_9ASCO|nr:hypothetical protein PMKS-001590 [Pichia membranifaciens]